MDFAQKIKQARQAIGVSQAEASREIGVSLRTYKAYELGESKPQNRKILQQIAAYYKVNINYLLTEGDEFIFTAAEKYGSTGRKQARQLVDQVIGLFAGGQLSDIDRDEAMQAIQQAYWDAKKINKKYAKKKESK